MNKLIGLMIWVSRKKYSEVFTVMVSTSLHPFNKKVSYQSFKDMIPSLKLNLVLVKQVLSQFQVSRLSMLPLPTPKL
jgi:hypothetical protein